jgi:hypothetical protein
MKGISKSFELSPAGSSAVWFIALVVIMPIAIFLLVIWNEATAFNDVPGWLLGLFFGLGPAIILGLAVSSRRTRVALSQNGLTIKASFINKCWPLAELDRSRAKVIDLQKQTDLKPKWKLWGAAMPGLSSGTFKLYNGDKAHVYITDKSKIVYIPTQNGTILLSLVRPKEFLDTLQAM